MLAGPLRDLRVLRGSILELLKAKALKSSRNASRFRVSLLPTLLATLLASRELVFQGAEHDLAENIEVESEEHKQSEQCEREFRILLKSASRSDRPRIVEHDHNSQDK